MPPNVLFVDDDRIVRHMVERHCLAYSQQFHLLLAKDGKQALELLQSASVALVVTDIQMPVMDGLELLARLSKTYPDIPVIIQTAYGSAENRRAGLMAGALEFIEKPIGGAAMAERILDVLNETRGNDQFRSIPLDLFAVLVEQERKTCTLHVTQRKSGQQGKLFFQTGRLLDAHSQDRRGEDAAREIFSWADTHYALQASCTAQAAQIAGGLRMFVS